MSNSPLAVKLKSLRSGLDGVHLDFNLGKLVGHMHRDCLRAADVFPEWPDRIQGKITKADARRDGGWRRRRMAQFDAWQGKADDAVNLIARRDCDEPRHPVD